jgi:peptidoglycan/xylan/chitin deacetylase (PgdA/CDA1 family)
MVGRFLQILIAKIKNAGGSVLFTLEEGMHDPKDMVTIEHLMQAIIHVKKEKEKIVIKADGISGFEDWKEI